MAHLRLDGASLRNAVGRNMTAKVDMLKLAAMASTNCPRSNADWSLSALLMRRLRLDSKDIKSVSALLICKGSSGEMSKVPTRSGFKDRGTEIVPVSKVEILPPSPKSEDQLGTPSREEMDRPDAAWRHHRHTASGDEITEGEFRLSDEWRGVLRYTIIGLVIAAILWKVAPVAQSAIPILVR